MRQSMTLVFWDVWSYDNMHIMYYNVIYIYIYTHTYMYTYCIYLNWYEARFTTKNNPSNILVAPRETSQAAGRWTLALQILDDAKASGTAPSGKHTKNYGKIHHFSWENQLFLWPFSIAMLNYQGVFSKNRGTSKNIQAELRTYCIDL